MSDKQLKEDNEHLLYMKLLKVCIDENNREIIDSMPMFLANILVHLPETIIPSLLDELKEPTIKEHRKYREFRLNSNKIV